MTLLGRFTAPPCYLVTELTGHPNDSTATETREFIGNYIQFNPKSRNAFLASLDTVIIGMERGESTADDMFSTCKQYIDNHKHKLYIFNDLRRVLGNERAALTKVLDYILSGKEEGKEVGLPIARH